jgi:hypothetical protein
LIIFPTGRSGRWNGATVTLDLPSALNYPYTNEELEEKIIYALDQCFSVEPDDNIKVSSLERYLNVKGYNKATKTRKLILIRWTQKDGYKVIPTIRTPKRGYDFNATDTIILGHEINKGALAQAVQDAFNKSTI